MDTEAQLQLKKRSVGRGRSLMIRSFLPFAARFLFRHPTKLGQLRQYWRGYIKRYRELASLTSEQTGNVEDVFYNLECQEPHFQELNGLGGVPMYHMLTYAAVRLMRPDVVVETGVAEGFSSWFILLALEQNGRGILHSIDLPNQDIELSPGGPRQTEILPEGKQTGFIVPENLRTRWQLHLGDAKELLPRLLQSLGKIDIFLHDSMHTYDHMIFEYRTAWTYLREGGVLLSDDVDLHTALSDFAAEVQCPYVIFNFQPRSKAVGAMRKAIEMRYE